MLERLDRAFTSQRQFIANASHELRTPLTLMRTAIDVVLAKPQPTRDELVSITAEVRQTVDHTQRLIEALLVLARNDQARTLTDPLDLAAVAEDALEGRTADGITTITTLHQAPVTGDGVLLERLVNNLLDNAERYNIAGGTIEISTITHDATSVLRVVNTGAVVPADMAEHLFLPFTRLDDRIRHARARTRASADHNAAIPLGSAATSWTTRHAVAVEQTRPNSLACSRRPARSLRQSPPSASMTTRSCRTAPRWWAWLPPRRARPRSARRPSSPVRPSRSVSSASSTTPAWLQIPSASAATSNGGQVLVACPGRVTLLAGGWDRQAAASSLVGRVPATQHQSAQHPREISRPSFGRAEISSTRPPLARACRHCLLPGGQLP
jgi:phospho-acceptor domain-containing protein/histidine kinase/DNA gyrase B/HSP90-like ATPase